MRRILEVSRSSRSCLWIFLAVSALAAATAAHAAPSIAQTNAFLASLSAPGSGCAAAAVSTAPDLPVFTPAPEPRGVGFCSPQCGTVSCRGAIFGWACTTFTGAPGTCHGSPAGKTCADGMPMCLCA
jgi:hypothetical protein